MGIDGSGIEESDSEGGGESVGDVRGERRVEGRVRSSLDLTKTISQLVGSKEDEEKEMRGPAHPESSKTSLQSPRNLVRRLALVVLDSEGKDIGSELSESSSHGELRNGTSIDFEGLSVASHDV